MHRAVRAGTTIMISTAVGVAVECVHSAYAAGPTAVSVEHLAAELERAYANAQFVHIEGSTETTAGDRLHYTYHGTPNSFRTICFQGDDLYGAYSLHAGRVQEFVPGHPQRLLLHYDAEAEDQIPQRVYPRELDCLYGHLSVRWVGSPSPQIAIVVQRVREGTLMNNTDVDGHQCYVVTWYQDWDNQQGELITNTWRYYIDANSYVLRRMVADYTAESDDEIVNSETRDFTFRVMKLSQEPSVIEWDIWPLVREAVPSGADGAAQDANGAADVSSR